jgi:hypothetical protein
MGKGLGALCLSCCRILQDAFLSFTVLPSHLLSHRMACFLLCIRPWYFPTQFQLAAFYSPYMYVDLVNQTSRAWLADTRNPLASHPKEKMLAAAIDTLSARHCFITRRRKLRPFGRILDCMRLIYNAASFNIRRTRDLVVSGPEDDHCLHRAMVVLVVPDAGRQADRIG